MHYRQYSVSRHLDLGLLLNFPYELAVVEDR